MLQPNLATFREALRQQGYVEGRNIAFELRTSRVTRSRVLRNPEQPVHVTKLRQAETTARALGIRLIVVDARGPEEFDTAFATIAGERAEGLIVFADGVFLAHRKRLMEHGRAAPPARGICLERVRPGGRAHRLRARPDDAETYRRAASFVGRIFKGANPATLPVEQPARFDLTVNLAAARTLGLTIPQSLLVRADQVIE